MKPTVITESTGIKIWPTFTLVAYLCHGPAVMASFSRSPFEPDVTPSSIKVSDTPDDGRYRKKIVFSVPESSGQLYARFLSLLKTYIVVVYTDERGVERIMGSPQWPAYLSVERSGGSLHVTVEALGDAPNPEFFKSEP